MANKNVVGDRIKLARKKIIPIVTQKDLAARLQLEGLHIERVTISKIETGYREVSDIESAAIAKVLGITAGWLFNEET